MALFLCYAKDVISKATAGTNILVMKRIRMYHILYRYRGEGPYER